MEAPQAKQAAGTRAVRLPRVCDLTGVSRASIWRWVKSDPTFPRPFHLSEAITCWDEAEVQQWIASKKAQHRADVAA